MVFTWAISSTFTWKLPASVLRWNHSSEEGNR